MPEGSAAAAAAPQDQTSNRGAACCTCAAHLQHGVYVRLAQLLIAHGLSTSLHQGASGAPLRPHLYELVPVIQLSMLCWSAHVALASPIRGSPVPCIVACTQAVTLYCLACASCSCPLSATVPAAACTSFKADIKRADRFSAGLAWCLCPQLVRTIPALIRISR